MKITNYISANLTEWMNSSQNLDTIKKVSTRSHVGFGTIQRIKNGEGNPTITNLCDIAHAFGKRVEDLIADPLETGNIVSIDINKPTHAELSPAMKELLALTDGMDEDQIWQLAGVARLFMHTLSNKKTTPDEKILTVNE